MGSLSLMRVPYLTGLFSKDVGLELVYGLCMCIQYIGWRLVLFDGGLFF